MEFYTFSRIEFYKLLKEASQAGATAALIDAGVISPIINRSEAFKKHTKHLIQKLEKAGMITPMQREHRGYFFYDVKELNNAIIAENRHRFFKGYGKDDEE